MSNKHFVRSALHPWILLSRSTKLFIQYHHFNTDGMRSIAAKSLASNLALARTGRTSPMRQLIHAKWIHCVIYDWIPIRLVNNWSDNLYGCFMTRLASVCSLCTCVCWLQIILFDFAGLNERIKSKINANWMIAWRSFTLFQQARNKKWTEIAR